jgi:uncharacterized protein YjbI with pentapeptide repeats
VFCAYLRMPYALPTWNELDAEQVNEATVPVTDDRDQAPHRVPGRDPAQEELQVRQTTQRILADHLRLSSTRAIPWGPAISRFLEFRRARSHPVFGRPRSIRRRRASGAKAQRRRPSPRRGFWPGIRLDLTGATLVNVDFAQISVVQALFGGAAFQGETRFVSATFLGDAWFRFATFRSDAWFIEATFQRNANFEGAIFKNEASFPWARFRGEVAFNGASFHGRADFSVAAFQRYAAFNDTAFHGFTPFENAIFQRDILFRNAIFQGTVLFSKATFEGAADFAQATFTSGNEGRGVIGAHVLHLDDPDLNRRRVWPDGCTVHPDPADPTRGTLIPAEDAKEPEPAVPPSDPTDTGPGTG